MKSWESFAEGKHVFLFFLLLCKITAVGYMKGSAQVSQFEKEVMQRQKSKSMCVIPYNSTAIDTHRSDGITKLSYYSSVCAGRENPRHGNKFSTLGYGTVRTNVSSAGPRSCGTTGRSRGAAPGCCPSWSGQRAAAERRGSPFQPPSRHLTATPLPPSCEGNSVRERCRTTQGNDAPAALGTGSSQGQRLNL